MSDVVVIAERRRSWPKDTKLKILAETEMNGESVLSVARRHEVDPAQIYQWRKKFRDEAAMMTKLVPVEIAGDETAPLSSIADYVAPSKSYDTAQVEPPTHIPSEDHIEVALKNGRHLFVAGDITPKRLAQLVAALETS